ncbi:alanine racemase [Gryllotalpicola daejeonensis]|uniref:Alanine racemase n=1 Tax=Gryllotalpicola daejeonensis TaxID=993087 RepID=A0ABP7ZI50_9MICO
MTARLVIDLAAFDRNVAALRARVAPAQFMLVVKNDAYGHGLEPIVSRALAQGVEWVGCLDLGTALAVRAFAGGAPRLFAWLLSPDEDLAAGIRADVDLGVGSAVVLEAVAATGAALGLVPRVHLKIDTGLNRNGVRREAWPEFVSRAAVLEAEGRVAVEGVWSHISEASDAEDDLARARFDEAVDQAREAGLRPRLRHLAASAAGTLRPEFDYDLVRIGAFSYGIAPAGGPYADELGITPIASLRAPVAAVEGGQAFVAVGAWHGLPSSAAGRVTVAVRGAARPVIRIDAEYLVIAAADAELAVGDEAVVFGDGAEHSITSTTWAEAIGTIGEELHTRLDARLPREYVG